MLKKKGLVFVLGDGVVNWEFRKVGFQWLDGENAVVLISVESGKSLPDAESFRSNSGLGFVQSGGTRTRITSLWQSNFTGESW